MCNMCIYSYKAVYTAPCSDVSLCVGVILHIFGVCNLYIVYMEC